LENALVFESFFRGKIFDLLGGDPSLEGVKHLCAAQVLIHQDLAHAALW
jgi:hypothetical protein